MTNVLGCSGTLISGCSHQQNAKSTLEPNNQLYNMDLGTLQKTAIKLATQHLYAHLKL